MSILAQFKEQVSLDIFTLDFIYAVGTAMILLAVIALCVIDAGLVRRKNQIDNWVQKFIAAFSAALGMAIIGYAIWQYQFYNAFGIPNPLGEAIKGWWIGGSNMTQFAHEIDPAVTPQADVFQVYAAFFIAFAMIVGVLLHGAVIERVKPLPIYILSFFAGAIVVPVVGTLTWGSVSFLTNNGMHDFVGVYPLYLVVGTWALILAWRAGPRRGVPVPSSLSTSALGVGLFLFAFPLAILSCGYFVPGSGYYGITLASSGVGIVLTNVFMAYTAGAISGGLIAYKTKSPVMALLGPAAGYIGCAAGMDIMNPWVTFIVAFFGPFAVYGGMLFMRKINVDEAKVVPLALFGGLYSAIATGIVGWGTKQGGYFGLEGKYAPQNAEVSLWMQLAGIGVAVGIAAVTGLILILLLEKTIGLRVSQQGEDDGLDSVYWSMPADNEALPAFDGASPLGAPVGAQTPA